MADVDPHTGPDEPTDLTAPAWRYTARRTLHGFTAVGGTDLAAALTYYAVLSIFPAALAVAAILGLAGRTDETIDTVVGVVDDVAGSSAADGVRSTVETIVQTPAAGWGLLIGVLGALWSASGYVRSFGRALNRVYGVGEGRPGVRLRLQMLAVTAGLLVAAAAVLLALVVTGPVARAVGDAIGLGSVAVTVWSIAKWPVLIAVVIVMVAVLYYATPNAAQPRFRWVSVGAVLAIAVWAVASVGFAAYVVNFGSYNKTYGTAAGAVVFLLWLWITNLALLLGAQLDAELERTRRLLAGRRVEDSAAAPVRDDREIVTRARRHDEDVARGRALRRTDGRSDGPH